jgi:Sigma-70, region 4
MSDIANQEPETEPDPIDLIARASDIAAVDDELNHLPNRYRDVLVMTYFAGQTSQQIADQLDESKGVIDGRLRQARNSLRVRLARRGVEFGVVAVAASLNSAASAAVPAQLIESTVCLAVEASANPVSSPVDISHLESLIQPELTAMSTKAFLSTGLAGITLAAAVGLLSQFPAVFGSDDANSLAGVTDSTPGQADTELVLPVIEVSASAQEATREDVPILDTVLDFTRAGAGVSGDASVTAGTPDPFAQYAGYSSTAKRKAAARIRDAISQECPPLDFPGEVPISEILQQIADWVSNTHGIRLHIVPDQAELEMEGISSLNGVTVTDVELDGITLHSALDLMFSQTSDPELDYIIRDEVMLVTTRTAAELDENMETRVYDVSRILPLFKTKTVQQTVQQTGQQMGHAYPEGFFSIDSPAGMARAGVPPGAVSASGTSGGVSSTQSDPPGGMGGASQIVDVVLTPGDQLLEVIQSMSSPPAQWFDIDGEGGRISAVGDVIVVRQSRRGHELIVDVLEQLEETAAMAVR